MINNNNPIAAMLLRVPHDMGWGGGGGVNFTIRYLLIGENYSHETLYTLSLSQSKQNGSKFF